MRIRLLEIITGKLAFCLAHLWLVSGLAGQERTIVRFYHGIPGDARAVEVVRDGRVEQAAGNRVFLILPQDAEICVEVINAHPIFYDYSFGVELDTTQITLPDVANFLAFLRRQLPDPAVVSALQAAGLDATQTADSLLRADLYGYFRSLHAEPQWWWEYAGNLKILNEQVLLARQTAERSDQPQSYPAQPGEEKDFRWARERILGLPATPGHFNDPDLEGTLTAWFAEARMRMEAGNPAPEDRILLEALRTFGESLLHARDALLTAFREASPVFKTCLQVQAFRSIYWLGVASRGTESQTRRAVGPRLLEIVVEPAFRRPVLELIPVAYALYRRNVAEFAVVDGRIRRTIDSDHFEFRVGGMLLANVKTFGARQEFAVGAGLGSNLFGTDAALSEFFLGALLSYRDLLRVGMGWGLASHRGLEAGLQPGDPLPEGKSLEDVLVDDDVSALFLVFSLKGIPLPFFGQ